MNRIVIPLIVLAGVIAAISVVSLASIDYSTNEQSNRYDKDTKTLEELTAMTCEQILKENVKGLQYFTEEGGEYIQEKVFECLKNEIPVIIPDELLKKENMRLDIEKVMVIIELEILEEMTCTEIIKHNSLAIKYASKENRQYARQQVLDCADDEEYLAYFGYCDQLFDKKRGGEPYQYEDHQKMADKRLKECGDEFWREDFDIDNKIDYEDKYE